MKKVSILLAFISGIALMAIISWKNNNEDSVKQDPENRPIIALRKIKLKAGVSAEAFEKFAIKAKNDEYCKLPGLKIYFGKGERGDEPDSYVYFLEFDSKATRDFYVPQEDDISKSS